jgi:transcriptional regulator with XRE-family HTH domain
MTSTLAERIDCLFRTHRSPRGREYTYREVADGVTALNGVTLSAAYLWQLRTGAKDNPSSNHLAALARFFNVAPSYFFDDELTNLPEAELRLLAATKHGLPRAAASHLAGLSDESLGAVLELARRLRQLEGLPGVEARSGNGTKRNGKPNGTAKQNGATRSNGAGKSNGAGRRNGNNARRKTNG